MWTRSGAVVFIVVFLFVILIILSVIAVTRVVIGGSMVLTLAVVSHMVRYEVLMCVARDKVLLKNVYLVPWWSLMLPLIRVFLSLLSLIFGSGTGLPLRWFRDLLGLNSL